MTTPVLITRNGVRCELYCGDCLEIVPFIEPVTAVVTDPPYNATEYQWDDFGNLLVFWEIINRVCRGACVLTSQQPIATDIINSNRAAFRYEWVWDKVNKYTNFLNAALMPLRRHELVLVFAVSDHVYNPQKRRRKTPYISRRTSTHEPRHYTNGNLTDSGRVVEDEWPNSIIEIKANMTTGILHPSQKPTELMEYLVTTYSNLNDTVLDPYMGSGTTGIACLRTGRNFIGIEKDPKHFATAVDRIQREANQGVLELK